MLTGTLNSRSINLEEAFKPILSKIKNKVALRVGIFENATQQKGFNEAKARGYLYARDKALQNGTEPPRKPTPQELETSTPDMKYVAQYAYMNEFGTPSIPSRPFMRNSVRNNKEKWVQTLKKCLERGMDSEDAIYFLGEEMRADIISEIETGNFAPNSPLTVEFKKLKGRTEPNRPLIDSGILEKSIDYQVVKK